MKSKPLRHSSEIEAEIRTVDPDVRMAVVRRDAAKLRLEELTRILRVQLVCMKGGEDSTNASNNVAAVCTIAQAPLGYELAALESIIRLIEGTSEFKEAETRLIPLTAELHTALTNEEEERRRDALAEQARRDAVEKAKAEAHAKIEAEFAVS